MRAADVTLSPGARRACERAGTSEIAVRRARARSTSEYDRPQYLVVIAELDDGRGVQLSCQHDQPEHVVSLTVVPRTSR